MIIRKKIKNVICNILVLFCYRVYLQFGKFTALRLFMEPCLTRPHYALRSSVRPVGLPTVNSKMENHTVFTLRGEVTHIRSIWRAILIEGHIMLVLATLYFLLFK